ncbi:hypothetical protein STANM309S_01916 [Streptomyces tanashiensis]
MFVIAILLVIAAVVLFFVGRANDSTGLKFGALGAVLAGLFSLIVSMTYVISAYEVGVPVAFGKVGSPMTSGMHVKSPFTDVTTFSTRPVDLNLSDKDVVEVRSSQGGVMYAEVTVKWSVDQAKAVELYKLAGSEDAIQQRLVYPDSREIVRNVFAHYTSEQGYASDREKRPSGDVRCSFTLPSVTTYRRSPGSPSWKSASPRASVASLIEARSSAACSSSSAAKSGARRRTSSTSSLLLSTCSKDLGPMMPDAQNSAINHNKFDAPSRRSVRQGPDWAPIGHARGGCRWRRLGWPGVQLAGESAGQGG